MMNDDPMNLFSSGIENMTSDIRKVDINFSVETPDMIIGAILVNCSKSPEATVVGKIFIYKYTTPRFIEANFDETYIGYLFENAAQASYDIANYTLKMLTIDFPSSVLNMSSSSDIGMVQLPQSINK